ncbi:MAG: glycosyltransferase family 2 protein [Acidobacteriota bacterium]|nr:glycosyltransferase family 2 protein [Acidobacteriota bacterium]
MLLILSSGGFACGFLLLRRIPIVPLFDPAHGEGGGQDGFARREMTASRAAATLSKAEFSDLSDLSIIIPARNEEVNLPALLASLGESGLPRDHIIVADDGSTDNTHAIAASFGATIRTVCPAPPGWRGKNWACSQGVLATSSSRLLFLDSDTRVEPEGLSRILTLLQALPNASALSILPFHITREPYEELSLFFNLLTAIGAGGFTGLDQPRLFGQSLLISRELYDRAGGHEAVRHHILENLHLAAHIRVAGGLTYTVAGRGTLSIRMFPHGIAQLRESWEKAFSDGASATSPLVLALSIYWLSAATMSFLLILLTAAVPGPIVVPGPPAALAALLLYLLFVAQIAWFSRQIGTFRLTSALLFPIPLVFYFALFGRSVWLRKFQRPTTWKGRQL